MKILFKKLSPFRNFDYIKFQEAGTEHDVSATYTDYTDETLESVIEVDGSEAEGGTVQLKGMPIREAQLVDSEGNEFIVEGDDIFNYIDRSSLCFYDERADHNGYGYLDELIGGIKGKLQDYTSSEFGNCYYWDKLDLGDIGLAYTEIDNEELGYSDVPVQVSLNLRALEVTTFLSGYLVDSMKFSPESLSDWLGGITFDELIDLEYWKWEKYSEHIADAATDDAPDDGWDAYVVANAYGSDEDYGSCGDDY